jgi:hypothetical protein
MYAYIHAPALRAIIREIVSFAGCYSLHALPVSEKRKMTTSATFSAVINDRTRIRKEEKRREREGEKKESHASLCAETGRDRVTVLRNGRTGRKEEAGKRVEWGERGKCSSSQVSPARCRPLNLRVEDLESGFLSERRDARNCGHSIFFLLALFPTSPRFLPREMSRVKRTFTSPPPKNAFTMPQSVL